MRTVPRRKTSLRILSAARAGSAAAASKSANINTESRFIPRPGPFLRDLNLSKRRRRTARRVAERINRPLDDPS
jgi:hypothetical protein